MTQQPGLALRPMVIPGMAGPHAGANTNDCSCMKLLGSTYVCLQCMLRLWLCMWVSVATCIHRYWLTLQQACL